MHIPDESIEAGLDYLRENADVAANARADRIYLEEYTKSLRALIMSEHPLLAVNAQEREALSDKRYLKHLEALREAVFHDERHKFRLRAVEARLSAWQTMNKVELAMKL